MTEEIKAAKVGIKLTEKVENEEFSEKFSDSQVNILLYADGIVLIAANENDLQFMLSIVENCCRKWRLEVNLTKTNLMHVRNVRCQNSKFVFLFNHRIISYCKTYTYLGKTLDEFLNFGISADSQAGAAGRALGSLITMTIENGGLPYLIYNMLYNCAGCAVADYGAEVWVIKLKTLSIKSIYGQQGAF